jgi:hypothetical protein
MNEWEHLGILRMKATNTVKTQPFEVSFGISELEHQNEENFKWRNCHVGRK